MLVRVSGLIALGRVGKRTWVEGLGKVLERARGLKALGTCWKEHVG